ncbi:MAG: RHS repeat-associated core domain-containing protein [Sulfurifustis sp.]
MHTDHEGTPRLATDNTQAVVWTWAGRAFGDTQPTGTATVNLRLPGIYADGETRLYYNWNRYFDPKTVRYLTSDPIGLSGGINTYTYVRNNPWRWIDKTGFDATAAATAGAETTAPSKILDELGRAAAGAARQCAIVALAIAAAGMSGSVPTCDDDGSGPPGCKKKDNGCEELYRIDTDTCNAITKRRGRRAGETCHASASERYAACLRGKPLPPLNTWNN